MGYKSPGQELAETEQGELVRGNDGKYFIIVLYTGTAARPFI